MSEAASRSSYLTIDWTDLIQTSREVQTLVHSLYTPSIGTGRVFYNTSTAHFNCAYIIRLWDKMQKIISGVKHQDMQGKDVLSLLNRLVDTKQIIDSSQRYLTQNRTSHTALDKIQEAASLSQMEKDKLKEKEAFELMEKEAFELVESSIEILSDRIGVALSAGELLKDRMAYIDTLSAISWSEGQGVTVPEQLLIDCRRDLKYGEKTIKASVRLETNSIKFSQQAANIEQPLLGTAWIPLRPQISLNDEIEFGKGVTGTSERDWSSDNATGICNFYYMKLPDGSVVISCGAIDNPDKARQLVASIKNIKETCPGITFKRVIIHSLNSFFSEKALLDRVHHAMAQARDALKTPDMDSMDLLHLNTNFTVTSGVLGEEQKSYREINIDALGNLVQFGMQDVDELLEQGGAAGKSEEGVLAPMSALCQEASELSNQIHQAKQKLVALCKENRWDANSVKRSPSVTVGISAGGNIEDDLGSSLDISHSLKDGSLMGSTETDACNGPFDNCSETEVESSEGLPEGVSDLKKHLKDLQDQLIETLSQLRGGFKEVISSLEKIREEVFNVYVEKALLIIQVLNAVLGAQSKSDPISRCTENELLFLLYRLLNITPVLTCHNGLDQSGLARSQHCAISVLFQKYFKEYSTSLGASQNSLAGKPSSSSQGATVSPQVDNQAVDSVESQCEQTSVGTDVASGELNYHKETAELLAYRDLLKLILNLDARRVGVYDTYNEVIKEERLSNKILRNLEALGEVTAGTVDLRAKVLGKFAAKDHAQEEVQGAKPYPGFNERSEAEWYQQTMAFLEIVGQDQLSPRALQTFYSSGVIGSKYSKSRPQAGLVTKMVASNPHPAQRLPMFIHFQETNRPPIQMLEFNRGWGMFDPSAVLTPIGTEIVIRQAGLR